MGSDHFHQLARSILELDTRLDRLRDFAVSCGVPSPEHQDWYALLKHKLLPQLSDKAFLIVAVMGGTNTGKSLVFNHLAGDRFSAVDHRASGTKHPVCLVPVADVPFETILGRHFDTFKLVRRIDAEQPLQETESHQLFWDTGKNVPDRLLLLDTPDVDSDRMVNWDRARAVRHAADVIIAVLTEQKYNDAAVRRFFREANEADKPVIVLFNMVDGDDTELLPKWLGRFSDETGVVPIAVLVSPFDKGKAERLELAFRSLLDDGTLGEPVDLGRMLSELHFDTIKSQTLLGAARVLCDPKTGLPSYLDTVEKASRRFAEALSMLEHAGEASVHWPGLPTGLLVEEIRSWWNSGRPGWSQRINGVYRTVGNGLLWPVRKASRHISERYLGGKPIRSEPLDDFRSRENQAVVFFVEDIIRRLEKIAETENPVLRREILELIGGENRAALLDRAHTVLNDLEPVDEDFRTILRSRLDDWADRNPQKLSWIRSLDTITTVARPVVTVTLVLSGMAVGAQVVSQTVGEMAIAGGITAGGEAAIHAGSEGAAHGTARLFQKIQEDYVLARSRRFYEEFQKELWQDVIDRLRTGAAVAESDVFLKCKAWSPGLAATSRGS